jgi:hypothetical protein
VVHARGHQHTVEPTVVGDRGLDHGPGVGGSIGPTSDDLGILDARLVHQPEEAGGIAARQRQRRTGVGQRRGRDATQCAGGPRDQDGLALDAEPLCHHHYSCDTDQLIHYMGHTRANLTADQH